MFDRLLEKLRQRKLLKERGKQRTDSTHVLASIRVMNRLETVVETMRAVLNELTVVAPEWLRSVASPEWQMRYGNRAEQSRLPLREKQRAAYGEKIGRDGVHLLKLIETEQPQLFDLEIVDTLRKVWKVHYLYDEDDELRWRLASCRKRRQLPNHPMTRKPNTAISAG